MHQFACFDTCWCQISTWKLLPLSQKMTLLGPTLPWAFTGVLGSLLFSVESTQGRFWGGGRGGRSRACPALTSGQEDTAHRPSEEGEARSVTEPLRVWRRGACLPGAQRDPLSWKQQQRGLVG